MNQNIYTSSEIRIGNERMHLLAEKAIRLPDYDMLLIADLHFGKVEHFRKNGFGVPAGASDADFVRFKNLVRKADARHVVFLGDLFHSDFNNAWRSFENVLEELDEFDFTLVIGNHDILDEDRYRQLHICHQLEIGGLILTHEPMEVIIENRYNLCGHIHPGVRLKGRGRQNLRLPCFYFGKHTGILPAFGSFTGLHVLKPLADDVVYVVEGENVIKVS